MQTNVQLPLVALVVTVGICKFSFHLYLEERNPIYSKFIIRK